MSSSPSFGVSLGLALFSLACWGSWSNAPKAARDVPFAVFYLDFSCGVGLVVALALAALGDGSLLATDDGVRTDNGARGAAAAAAADDGGASDLPLRGAAALCAGAAFNLANLLLVVAIRLAGLAVAFPIGIGTALVLDTALT